jgi:hypothetical protein
MVLVFDTNVTEDYGTPPEFPGHVVGRDVDDILAFAADLMDRMPYSTAPCLPVAMSDGTVIDLGMDAPDEDEDLDLRRLGVLCRVS